MAALLLRYTLCAVRCFTHFALNLSFGGPLRHPFKYFLGLLPWSSLLVSALGILGPAIIIVVVVVVEVTLRIVVVVVRVSAIVRLHSALLALGTSAGAVTAPKQRLLTSSDYLMLGEYCRCVCVRAWLDLVRSC